ncbi:MAG: family 1 extracellular solute-binding protein [Paenibacillus sp.]|jgi:multiple sugar transport system substrate-binding protein|nr:family 1 extracellular solute-binding protein [Paenibacillus sp.]
MDSRTSVVVDKRLWLALPAVAGLLLVLGACGGKSSEGKAADVTGTPAVITFFTANDTFTEEQFMNDQGGAMIRKKFPNFTIKNITRNTKGGLVQDLVASGTTFDILRTTVGSTPGHLMDLNLQNDISDLVKKYNYDLNRLEPTTVEAQRTLSGGGIYGLPFKTDVASIMYNKDLFDKFGVSYPKDGMTWDEMYSLAQRMTRTEGGQQYRGLSGSFQHLMMLNPLSVPFADPKTHKSLLTSDAFTHVFSTIARFFKIPGNDLFNNYDAFFKDRNMAMIVILTNDVVNKLRATPDAGASLNWDFVQLPHYPEKPQLTQQSYPYYYYLTSTSKSRDAAFQVLAYLTSDEFQEWGAELGNVPILKDNSKVTKKFAVNVPEFKGKNIKALLLDKYAPMVVDPLAYNFYTDATNALSEYVKGNADLNTALRQAAEVQDKNIANLLHK